jgi:hypothetical protein
MAKRIWGLIAVLGLGLVLAPPPAAQGGASHGGGLRAPVGKSAVHARAAHGFGARGLHRRDPGVPFAAWWGAPWYGGTYEHDSTGTVVINDRTSYSQPFYFGGPYPPPFAAPEPKRIDVIVYRPGCRSDSQTVPWPDGKEHTITMVRC